MADGKPSLGAEIPSVPIGEMVRSMALAVAEAQFELDKSSLMVAEFMSGHAALRSRETGQLVDGEGKPAKEPVVVDSRIQFGHTFVDGKRVPNKVSMLELGFVPTFYQFVDTVIEVKIALKVHKLEQKIDPGTGRVIGGEAENRPAAFGAVGGITVASTPIDAAYASSYGFSLDLASVFKTKLVCVPPPAALEERLRLLIREEASNVKPEGSGS